MSIKIVFPTSEGPQIGSGINVYTQSGKEITGIRRIMLSPIEPGLPVTAQLDVYVDHVENMVAEEVINVVDPREHFSDEKPASRWRLPRSIRRRK